MNSVVLEDGQVGDVFVRGTGLVQQYWNNPEGSSVFKNKLEGIDGLWYNSGDLGYVKESKLYLTGRSKDVLIYNGKNIYATDMESVCENQLCAYIRPGCSAAFQTGDGTAAILCEMKTKLQDELSIDSLVNLKGNLEEEFGMQITDILCCPKGTVPKTTSGKIKRYEAKRLFLEGKIKAIAKLIKPKLFRSFEELLVSFDIANMNATLLQNGIDSLRLTRLIEEAQTQFGVAIDFEKAQSVPCKDLQTLSTPPITATEQKPRFPDCSPRDETMSHYVLLQIVGVLMLVAVVSVCTIPAAYLYLWANSADFASDYPNLVDPLAHTFHGGPGLLVAIVPLIWMVTFTVMVVILKWVVVGTYVQNSHSMWSPAFFRWWFMDRLVSVWECFVGSFLFDTPHLNMFYMAMGCNIDISSVRLKLFLREFDLFTAEPNTCIGGIVSCRVIDARGLIMRSIVVQKDTEVKGWSFAYPGETISHLNPSSEKSESIATSENIPMPLWLQIQRWIFPLFIFIGYLVAIYIWSWIYSHWVFIDRSLALDGVKIVIMFYGNNLLLLGLSGMFARTGLVDYTADRMGMVCFGMIRYWVDMTQIVNFMLWLLYGAKISMYAQLNSFQTVAPSQARYLTVKAGSTVSFCSISATKENPTVIGENCTIGAWAKIEEGVTVGDGSAVSTLSVVKVGTVVESEKCYFNDNFITKAITKERELAINTFTIIFGIISKFGIQWTLSGMMFYTTIMCINWFTLRMVDWPIALSTPIFTFLSLMIAGCCFLLIDVFLSHYAIPAGTIIFNLLVPEESQYEKTPAVVIPLGSFRSAFYMTQLAHRISRQNYTNCFIGGTALLARLESLCGAAIEDPDRVFLYGQFFDPKYLTIYSEHIQPGDSSYERDPLLDLGRNPKDLESHTADTKWFVADNNANFGAHRLEYGKLILETSDACYGASLHQVVLILGQNIGPDVTVAAKSRIFFIRDVTKRASGVYSGVPASEYH